MHTEDVRKDLAIQISKLPDDQVDAVANYLHELMEAENQKAELLNQYLTFWSDGQLFAVGVRQVVQIIQTTEITPLPDFPPYMKGVISLRGEMVPVMDFRMRLGKEETVYNAQTCIIIVSMNDRSFGLIVDAVSNVETIPEQDICPPPKQTKRDVNYLTGIAKRENVILILAMDYLLSEEEIGTILNLSDDIEGLPTA